MTDDAIMESVKHSQRIAYKQGTATLAVEVWGWAMKHALELPAPAYRELLEMLTKEDE